MKQQIIVGPKPAGGYHEGFACERESAPKGLDLYLAHGSVQDSGRGRHWHGSLLGRHQAPGRLSWLRQVRRKEPVCLQGQGERIFGHCRRLQRLHLRLSCPLGCLFRANQVLHGQGLLCRLQRQWRTLCPEARSSRGLCQACRHHGNHRSAEQVLCPVPDAHHQRPLLERRARPECRGRGARPR